MGGAWKWCTQHPPHPELSHPATFTARMAGSVVQLCPGSWETMFGDQLASLWPQPSAALAILCPH